LKTPQVRQSALKSAARTYRAIQRLLKDAEKDKLPKP